jgi:hypothetical protein
MKYQTAQSMISVASPCRNMYNTPSLGKCMVTYYVVAGSGIVGS